MRTPVIAGNWKMNKTPAEAAALVTELKPLVKDAGCDVVVCVPAVDFAAVKEAIDGSNIHLGAQNVHFAASGAYTGELSADMLKAAGVEYVISGHSERRQYFGETDKTVNLRVKAAVAAGLKVILCVGENKEEREARRDHFRPSGSEDRPALGHVLHGRDVDDFPRRRPGALPAQVPGPVSSDAPERPEKRGERRFFRNDFHEE